MPYLLASLRWLELAALSLWIGGVVLEGLFAWTLTRAGPAEAALTKAAEPRRQRLERLGLGLLLVASLVQLGLAAGGATTIGGPARVAIAAVLAGLGWALAPHAPTAVRAVFAAIAALLGVTGHATSPVQIPLAWLHALGVALWLGGILQLTLAVLPATRALATDRAQAFATVLRRFSPLAAAGLALLLVSGTLRLWLDPSAWSLTLGLKLALAFLLALAGLWQTLRVRPRFERTPPTDRAGAALALATHVQAALALAVLTAGAALTVGHAARAVAEAVTIDFPWSEPTLLARPDSISREVDGLAVTLTLEPTGPSAQRARVAVTGANGSPTTQPETVTIHFTRLPAQTDPVRVTAQRDTGPRPGETVPCDCFAAEGQFLTITGAWRATVDLTFPDGRQTQVGLPLRAVYILPTNASLEDRLIHLLLELAGADHVH